MKQPQVRNKTHLWLFCILTCNRLIRYLQQTHGKLVINSRQQKRNAHNSLKAASVSFSISLFCKKKLRKGLKFLSKHEVELAATNLLSVFMFAETISPVDTHQTNHR